MPRVPRLLRNAGPTNEWALRAWAAWTAEHDDRFQLGATRDAVLASVDAIQRAAAAAPLNVGAFRVDEHTVPLLLITGLADDHDETNAALAEIVHVLDLARTAGAAEPTPLVQIILQFLLTGDESTFGSAQAAILCADRAAPRDPDRYLRDIEQHRRHEPHFGALTRNIGPCAYWPHVAREPLIRIDHDRPVLIVAATGDPRTLYPDSLAMHRMLSGSRLVTLHDARRHAVYGEYGSACVDDHLNNYLRGGVLPPADQDCANDAQRSLTTGAAGERRRFGSRSARM